MTIPRLSSIWIVLTNEEGSKTRRVAYLSPRRHGNHDECRISVANSLRLLVLSEHTTSSSSLGGPEWSGCEAVEAESEAAVEVSAFDAPSLLFSEANRLEHLSRRGPVLMPPEIF
jgi:hypothetical protein